MEISFYPNLTRLPPEEAAAWFKQIEEMENQRYFTFIHRE